jgi:SAM-dependent methyltransferase
MDETLMRATIAADERHWWYRGRRRVILAELDALPHPPGMAILDAGCGSGRMMVELAEYGSVHGVELDPGAARVARDRGVGEIREGRVEELPWGDASFDGITCLDVIEHTADDRLALEELRRVCRAGGWLLLTVPAYAGLWSSHDVANHHFRRYSRPALRDVLARAGWTLTRLSSFNSLLLAPAAAVRLAERRRPPGAAAATDLDLGPRWLNRALEWPLAAEAGWLRRGRTLPVGLSLLAVARRGGER